jgi:alkyldihydroxyacetonephosphate synthase
MESAGDIIEELRKLIAGKVTQEVGSYLQDRWPLLTFSDEEIGKALFAVKPSNVEDVARLVGFANEKKIALYTRGGGSSVTGASIPLGGVVVDMTAMNQVLDVDETNRTVTVEAGIKLNEIEAKLNQKGFTLGQVPQSFELATIGGFMSTMGTGEYSTSHGGIEDTVLRLEVVLPSGQTIWTKNRGAPRSSVGPDLAKLFLGSEGAFGIICTAELKIRKVSQHVLKAAYMFADLQTGMGAIMRLMELDVLPSVCRLYSDVDARLQFGEGTPTLLLIYEFNSESVYQATREEVSEIVEAEGVPAGPELVDKWLEERFRFREQNDRIKAMGLVADTIEVASKWSRVLDLYYDVTSKLSETEGVTAVGAHVSHMYHQGACLYFTVLFKPEKDLYWSIWNMVSDIAQRHDATISHHHGVGILKKQFAKKEVPQEFLHLLKDAIDPKGILNPQKFI